MSESIRVNHVLSTRATGSRIFDNIIHRFIRLAPDGFDVSLTVRPDKVASLHHHHRPHLERRLRPKSVVTVHHDIREAHFWLRPKSFFARYREAETVICLNRTQRALLAERGIHHTTVIPHGVDRAVLPVPPRPRTRREGPIRLGLFSQRYPRGVKGEALLHRLMAKLSPGLFAFTFVGRGRWQDAALARERGFETVCHETLPYRLFGRLYDSIDILLILSDFEGGPACLPEALGYGVPVICRPVGMCPDYMVDGVHGYMIDGDADAFAERLTEIARPGSRELDDLFSSVWARAGEIPSWEEIIDRHFGLYRQICGPAGGPSPVGQPAE